MKKRHPRSREAVKTKRAQLLLGSHPLPSRSVSRISVGVILARSRFGLGGWVLKASDAPSLSSKDVFSDRGASWSDGVAVFGAGRNCCSSADNRFSRRAKPIFTTHIRAPSPIASSPKPTPNAERICCSTVAAWPPITFPLRTRYAPTIGRDVVHFSPFWSAH